MKYHLFRFRLHLIAVRLIYPAIKFQMKLFVWFYIMYMCIRIIWYQSPSGKSYFPYLYDYFVFLLADLECLKIVWCMRYFVYH